MATTPQTLESLRRQLEGRWASIEQARMRYATLTRRLASFHWKRALRDEPELLTRTREQEPELDEVLAYMEHRARVEQWPPEHPGLGVLHELRSQRAKLESLARKRLVGPLSLQQAHSFSELLEQLEALARAPQARIPPPEEPVLLEGWLPAWPGPGHFWLTPERLVWRPWLGEPVQTSLESLTPDSPLPSFGQAREIKSLLELCRQLARRQHEQPKVLDPLTPPMYLHHPDYPSDRHWGLGVLGPHGLDFLPVSPPPLLERVRRFVGLGTRTPDPELRRLVVLVEHLQRLPSDTFAQALGKLTHARGGRHYGLATGLVRLPDRGLDTRLQASELVLVAPNSVYSAALNVFLSRHPAPENAAVSGKAPASWWWRHYKEKLGIALGALLAYLVTFMMPGGLHWLTYLLGQGLSFWSGARYAKAKSHPWWLGLLLTVGCAPVGALVLFFLPEKKPSERFGPFMRE